MTEIRTITFDLDDTLWEIHPVIKRAEQRLYAWLGEHYPRITDMYEIEDIRAIRAQVINEIPDQAYDLTLLRRVVLERIGTAAGYQTDFIDEAFDVFDEVRNDVDIFPGVIPTLESLNLPPRMQQLCRYDQGMILLAGMTGTGKTTTIAAMLDWINHHYRKHILTIEDPIEYIFKDDLSLINQREIGESVKDFAVAMKHAVREDPDVILVGEMRDAESISTALHAAETGHLVFGTVHASTAATTVGRILDLFPQAMHSAIRSSMAFNMKAIIAQKLLPTVLETPPRVPIVELMMFSPMVRKLVLEGQDVKLADAIVIGRGEGMQTFDDSLYDFVRRGYLDQTRAVAASQNAEAFKMRLKGIEVKSAGLL